MNPLVHSEHDDLERQLHAGLEHYAPEAPDRLWAGIEAELPKRRRRRPVLWWWLFGVGAALVFVGLAYHFATEHTIAVPELRRVEPEPAVKQNIALQSAQERPTKGTSTLGVISQAATHIGMTEPEAVNQPAVHFKIFNRGKDVFRINAPIPDILPEKLSIENTGTTQNLMIVEPAVALSPVKPLFSTLASVLKNDLPKIQPFHFPVKPKRERHWEIGIASSPVWLWQAATPTDPHHGGHIAFAEHQQGAATGWQRGLTIGYGFLPHWRVTTGLLRRNTTQVSSHTATLRLMDGICLNPNDYGPKEYEFQYGLYSGAGESDLTVHIAQVDTAKTMPDDEPFVLAMRTTRRSADWVLPLTVQRAIGSGRWQGFVQAGIQMKLPGNASAQVDHFTEACIDLCFASGRMPALTVAERGKASVSWLLGAGLEYRLSPGWGLSLTPTFFGRKGQTGISLNAGLSFKL